MLYLYKQGYSFLSTSPARGTTSHGSLKVARRNWFSIHVPREGDDAFGGNIQDYKEFSIHVPREGDDLCVYVRLGCQKRFSIHVPREGDDKHARDPQRGSHFSIHVPREGDDSKY